MSFQVFGLPVSRGVAIGRAVLVAVRENLVPVGPVEILLLEADQVKAHLALQQAGLTAIPNLTYDYFPSSKHWLFWDEPERYRDAVDRFLNTVTRPAVSGTKGRPKG